MQNGVYIKYIIIFFIIKVDLSKYDLSIASIEMCENMSINEIEIKLLDKFLVL